MKFFVVLILAVFYSGAQNSHIVESKKKYRLVWADEFNYRGKPNNQKWGYETGFVRNMEAQYYTERARNARVESGNLIIESHKEKIANALFKSAKHKNWRFNQQYTQYTSASLTTKDIAEWKYGKIEVRAKLPKGIGSWSAIWMLGKQKDVTDKRSYSEIDIMEHVGFEPNTIYGTAHSKNYDQAKTIEQSKKIKVEDPSENYHIYSVEWTPNKIVFMADGVMYHQILKKKKNSAWNFDQKLHLKINNAIGGSWGGKNGIDDKTFPQKMYVDYVRVYQLQT